ncbi:hypothetical protein [Nostoc sp.]
MALFGVAWVSSLRAAKGERLNLVGWAIACVGVRGASCREARLRHRL